MEGGDRAFARGKRTTEDPWCGGETKLPAEGGEGVGGGRKESKEEGENLARVNFIRLRGTGDILKRKTIRARVLKLDPTNQADQVKAVRGGREILIKGERLSFERGQPLRVYSGCGERGLLRGVKSFRLTIAERSL